MKRLLALFIMTLMVGCYGQTSPQSTPKFSDGQVIYKKLDGTKCLVIGKTWSDVKVSWRYQVKYKAWHGESCNWFYESEFVTEAPPEKAEEEKGPDFDIRFRGMKE